MPYGYPTEVREFCSKTVSDRYFSIFENLICTVHDNYGPYAFGFEMDKTLHRVTNDFDNRSDNSNMTWVVILRNIDTIVCQQGMSSLQAYHEA